MKRLMFLLSLSLFVGHVCFGAPLSIRDIVYTTEGNLLLREVTDSDHHAFSFEECTLLPSNENSYEGRSIGACYSLSPRYRNSPEATQKLNAKFGEYIKNEMRGLKNIKRFSSYVLPFLTVWGARGSLIRWRRFFTPAFEATRFQTGAVATGLTLLTVFMATVVWDAWTTQLPSIETTLQRNQLRAENDRHGSLSGVDVYLLVRTALRQTISDPTIVEYQTGQ